MNFQDINIKSEYRSLTDNVVNDFYIPILKKAVLYKRAVGFFSSTALIEISKGLTGLINNGGRIMLIASPRLQQEDVEAMSKGYEERKRVIEQSILNSFTEPKNYFEQEQLNLLAHLVADGRLDIKIAFTERNNVIGMYHEKVGLLYDDSDNVIAFTGSMNETSTAFSYNYETIDVFCSWTSDVERVHTKEKAFSSLWNDYEPNIKIVDFPQVAIEKLQSYKNDTMDKNINEDEFKQDEIVERVKAPRSPLGLVLHNYQLQAIEEWAKKGYRGIFDMATGTGKTFTGLGAVVKLSEQCNDELAVIIVCPFQHLVEQWIEDIVKFNMKPIVGYSASSQKDWKRRLKDAVISYNLGVRKHFCFITTNATFSSDYVKEQVEFLKGNILLIVDEAHNFGATNLSKTLNPKIPYRLALSATLERHGDEEGTEKLSAYFGEKCIEYSLERAIQEKKLTPYYYYPVDVYLNEDELAAYKAITKDLIKHCTKDKKGKFALDEYGKLLLIKRARIVAATADKIANLAELMEKYKDDKHILVYCGAATMQDLDYQDGKASADEMRQIDVVSDLLGNRLGMRISKFTSEESAEERERLKVEFSCGQHLQALIAIRCLDEGVNIPSIKMAFILASSTNPKEYVQRRGRVLRKFEGKNHAIIFDFVTLPRPLDQVRSLTEGEVKVDISLVRKEIARMKDFAVIAENPSDSDKLINEIEQVYDLNKLGGENDAI